MKILYKTSLAFMLVLFASCAGEFVETEPTNNLPGESLIVDVASAEAALNGMYSALQFDGVFGGDDTFYAGLYSDELIHAGSFPSFAEIGVNDPAINNVEMNSFWTDHYVAIYRANLVIQGAQNPDAGLSEAAIGRIVGQARGVRALMYFDLVRRFGAVPLSLTAYTSASEIDTNPLPRTSTSEVYAQIATDVNFAMNNLPDGLSRYQFNKDAATVLKARVEMEMGMYEAAESTLSPLIGEYSLEADYASLFTGSASSSETIFAVDFNETDGSDHAFFYLDAGRGEVAASGILINEFEENDTRISQIDLSAADVIKYKDAGTGNDDAYVYRYADVLLMYAEVLARMDDPTASDYINMVRERAGLDEVVINSANVVDVIAHERFVEFYAEGDRLNTIVRLGIAEDVILSKPGNVVYVPERNFLWPIPQQEIERNSAISVSDQNAGY